MMTFKHFWCTTSTSIFNWIFAHKKLFDWIPQNFCNNFAVNFVFFSLLKTYSFLMIFGWRNSKWMWMQSRWCHSIASLWCHPWSQYSTCCSSGSVCFCAISNLYAFDSLWYGTVRYYIFLCQFTRLCEWIRKHFDFPWQFCTHELYNFDYSSSCCCYLSC